LGLREFFTIWLLGFCGSHLGGKIGFFKIGPLGFNQVFPRKKLYFFTGFQVNSGIFPLFPLKNRAFFIFPGVGSETLGLGVPLGCFPWWLLGLFLPFLEILGGPFLGLAFFNPLFSLGVKKGGFI